MPSTNADDDGNRGTGRTTAQMKRAPQRALIVVPNLPFTRYAKDLAFKIGRNDLQFISLESAKRYGWQRTRGLRGRDAVMLDHACWHFMNTTEREEFSELQHAYEW